MRALLNALFERDLLPIGSLLVDSVASVVTIADRLGAEVRYLDGRVQSIRLGEATGLVSQRGNPDNVKRVNWVWITCPPHTCQPAPRWWTRRVPIGARD